MPSIEPALSQSAIKYYARLFGLPVGRIKLFGQLSAAQKNRVTYLFSSTGANKFVYATKDDGDMVWSRHKRDNLIERQDE